MTAQAIRRRHEVEPDQERKRGLMLVLLVAPFLAQADATIVNVATPAIRSTLHTSGATAELVVGGYLIAFAVLLITGARLGQTHGYKRLFIVGLAIFGGSSLIAGAAPSAAVLVTMRVLQGAGAALMFPQALTGIQLNFMGERRARAIGLYAIALSAGAVIGQILGGVLVTADIANASWRPVFLVNVPICAAFIAAGLRLLPRDEDRRGRRLDLLGVAGLSLTLGLIVVPLTLGREAGWPPWAWVCLGMSVPAFSIFLRRERQETNRGGSPVINLTVVRQPPVLLALLALLLATATYYALLFTLAQYFQQGLHRSALTSGLILVPWVAAFGAAGQITRRLPQRVAPLLPLFGCILLAGAYLAIGAVELAAAAGYGLLALLLAIGGLGLGTNFVTLIGHLTNAVAKEYAPDISGVSTTLLQIGGTLGVAALGSFYLALAQNSEQSASRGFAMTSLVLGIVALAGAALALAATSARSER